MSDAAPMLLLTETLTLVEPPVVLSDDGGPVVIVAIGILAVMLCSGGVFLLWRNAKAREEEKAQHDSIMASLSMEGSVQSSLSQKLVRRERVPRPPPPPRPPPSATDTEPMEPQKIEVEGEEDQPPPPPPPDAPDLTHSIDMLLRSRAAGERHVPQTPQTLVQNARTDVLQPDEALAEEGQGTAFVKASQIQPLAPQHRIAMSGCWVSSTGLRLEVGGDGTVTGGDGSTAALVQLDDGGMALRTGHRLLRMEGTTAGPAPESVKWEDGTRWSRRAAQVPIRNCLTRPPALFPGLRVDTPEGRGTLLRLYKSLDASHYWYVRLDSAKDRERLFSAYNLKQLPWFSQDAVLQRPSEPPPAFQDASEDEVNAFLAEQKRQREDYERAMHIDGHEESVNHALHVLHQEAYERKQQQQQQRAPSRHRSQVVPWVYPPTPARSSRPLEENFDV